MNLFLLAISPAIQFALLLIFTALVIPHKLNAIKIAAISLGVVAITMARLTFEIASSAYLIINLFLLLAALSVPAIFYKGKLIKRYLVFIFFLVIMGIADIIPAVLIRDIYGSVDALRTELAPMVIFLLIGTATYVLLASLSVSVWKMIEVKKFKSYYIPLFTLPIGLLVAAVGQILYETIVIWAIGTFLVLISGVILLVYVVSLDKKAAIEEELNETRHRAELEQQHYRELELRQEELAKLRHDFNNQLTTISHLIRKKEENNAQDMIQALSKEIMGTRVKLFCNIPVINAILTQKTNESTLQGIKFLIDLNLPETLYVEQIHLCSIFANLSDNAITACKERVGSEESTINLSTMTDGDYIFVKVTNPSEEPPDKPAPGRGYGSRILSDLAKRYSGDYKVSYEDGIFTAIVSLLNEERQ